jgi:hypothetical protein
LLANTLVKPERQIAEGYGMTYSETAGDEVIPALPIKGVANNRVFVAKTIVFRHGLEGKWKLEISDYEFDALQGVANARFEKKDIQTIYINFDQEPVAGDKILREMAYGGGYFQLKKSSSSMDTTSWNTSIAYAIEITGWNKGASHPESWLAGTCSSPDIGKASGKLYISFKGSDIGYPNAWVSGAFNDVMIIYCGE